MITKEYLEARKTQLTAEREQHVARANMTSGALLLIDALLSEIDAKPTDPPEQPPAE